MITSIKIVLLILAIRKALTFYSRNRHHRYRKFVTLKGCNFHLPSYLGKRVSATLPRVVPLIIMGLKYTSWHLQVFSCDFFIIQAITDTNGKVSAWYPYEGAILPCVVPMKIMGLKYTSWHLQVFSCGFFIIQAITDTNGKVSAWYLMKVLFCPL